MDNIIELTKIKKEFGKKEGVVKALSGVDMSVRQGEMVAIMGKSGSGKSTLLNIIGGMLSFDSGEYYYDGKIMNSNSKRELVRFRRNEIGFVVQYFALIEDLNVYNNVALPLKYQGYSRKKINTMVRDILEKLDIADKAKAYPDELSGGQKQRVAIARAIVKEPRVILADEPTGALDETTGNVVMDIFRDLNKSGKTIIIVTHDLGIANKCDRIIQIKDGLVVNK